MFHQIEFTIKNNFFYRDSYNLLADTLMQKIFVIRDIDITDVVFFQESKISFHSTYCLDQGLDIKTVPLDFPIHPSTVSYTKITELITELSCSCWRRKNSINRS
ncbi:hypothetical protein BpHYR1_009248, partial [Brachionus plicatilis]